MGIENKVQAFSLETNEPEYWTCIVGPITRDKLPLGGDLPMRKAVEEAFHSITGQWPQFLSSGWGHGESHKDAIQSVVCAYGDKFTVKIEPG